MGEQSLSARQCQQADVVVIAVLSCAKMLVAVSYSHPFSDHSLNDSFRLLHQGDWYPNRLLKRHDHFKGDGILSENRQGGPTNRPDISDGDQ